MDERTAARAFEAEVAAILSGAPPAVDPNGRGSGEFSRLAEELRGLATAFGRQASPALQRKIVSVARRAQYANEHPAGSNWTAGSRLLRFGVGTAVAATLIILAVPTARQAVARQMYRVLDVVAVGPATQVVRPDASTPGEISSSIQQFERQLSSGKGWHLSTPYGGFGGGVPSGASPALQRVDRVDVLSSLTPMSIQLPTAHYRGTVPPFSYALVAPDGVLFLFFGSDNKELLLVQAPIRPGGGVTHSRVIASTDKQGRYSQYSPELKTEELILNGQNVVWDPDNTGVAPNSSALRWERDAVSYSLVGRALTKDEAVHLFLSFRPADTSRPR